MAKRKKRRKAPAALLLKEDLDLLTMAQAKFLEHGNMDGYYVAEEDRLRRRSARRAYM